MQSFYVYDYESCMGGRMREESMFKRICKSTKLISTMLVFAMLMSIFMPMGAVQAAQTGEAFDKEWQLAHSGLEPMECYEMEEEPDFPTEEDPLVQRSAAEDTYWLQFTNDYYYNQISAQQKLLWDRLEDSCLNAVEGNEWTEDTYVDASDLGLNFDEVSWVVVTFRYANPQFYFLKNRWGYYNRGNQITAVGIMLYEEFYDGNARADATLAFRSKIDEWVAQINTATRPEEKEKIAHDIIAVNTLYDLGSPFNQSAYSLVCLGETVCAGYAATMQILMNAAGIETIEITSASHAWNAVKLYDEWYLVDVTWDDTDREDVAYYLYYNKAEQADGAHLEEDRWTGMTPEQRYDSSINAEWEVWYSPAYFTQGDFVYFKVNDNPALGERTVRVVETLNGATADKSPTQVKHEGKTYTVMQDLVENFVSRMYTVVLDRTPDATGMAEWTGWLKAKTMDGAALSEGFILSPEFIGKNVSNEEYVNILYRTFFDREADAAGKATWIDYLNAGTSRRFVLAGFVNSTEFAVLCAEYGIDRGTMDVTGEVVMKPAGAEVRSFVERLYGKVLGRESDESGMSTWAGGIASGTFTAEEAAKKFFASEEFLARGTDDAEYVEVLYQTFMGRASDEEGKALWLEQLNGKMDRMQVLEGFSRSEEFKKILASFGL